MNPSEAVKLDDLSSKHFVLFKNSRESLGCN